MSFFAFCKREIMRHENAVELAEGERPELWITPEGKLFFKKEKC